MREAILFVAVAAASAYAQNRAAKADLEEKLRHAVVHVQTTDRELERAEELRARKASIDEFRRCRIHQPYLFVVSGVAIAPKQVLTVALHPRADLRILVTHQDGREQEARLIATDPVSNLALIELPEATKHFLTINEQAVRVREDVTMAGFQVDDHVTRPVTVRGHVNTEQMPIRIKDLYGATRSGVITLGTGFAVVTREGRPNAGSACLDGNGDLVGLVVGGLPTYVLPDPENPGQRIAYDVRFAVPAARVARIVSDLRRHGRVIRAYYGVVLEPAPAELREHFELPASACYVTAFRNDGPMAKAGIRLNDVILTLDGKNYKDMHQLGEAMTEKKPGEPVKFEILRKGRKQPLLAVPEEWVTK